MRNASRNRFSYSCAERAHERLKGASSEARWSSTRPRTSQNASEHKSASITRPHVFIGKKKKTAQTPKRRGASGPHHSVSKEERKKETSWNSAGNVEEGEPGASAA